MHDANHGAYSRSKKINSFFGGLLNLVGAYHVNWKIQHNVLHHTYTNIYGHDEDIRKTAYEYNLPYKSHPTFIDALRSHFGQLNRLSVNPETVDVIS
jgi:linoleoyl-CoA desaturase